MGKEHAWFASGRIRRLGVAEAESEGREQEMTKEGGSDCRELCKPLKGLCLLLEVKQGISGL